MVHGDIMLVIRKKSVLRYVKVCRTGSNLEPNLPKIFFSPHMRIHKHETSESSNEISFQF